MNSMTTLSYSLCWLIYEVTLSDPYSAATHFEGVTVGIVTVEEVKVKSQKTRSLRVTVHLLINNWIDQGVITRRIIVEEVFEFKEVPENKRVSLIATKLHGRASAWWQQLKLTREGWKSKSYQFEEDDEFIEETDDQLVSHYIGGLRVHIIDFVNMFDPVTLSDAYQHALAFEKQNRRVGSSSSPAITGVEMDDMTQQETLGTVKDVLVKFDKFEFPCDFVVTDMLENLREMIS
ncbi:hypothetical protein Tco_1097394 [Tanacetum coccineum]